MKNKAFRATYRLQLEKTFGFKAARNLLPYLEDLGVSHLYLSPIFEARPGSRHGYDAINVQKISEERGGEQELGKLLAGIQGYKSLKGAILDIVPNHLATHHQNPLWWDVLKFGPDSKYWEFFDFRPRRGRDRRIVLPFLGRGRRALVASGEIKFEARGKEWVVTYYDRELPINPKSYPKLSSKMTTAQKEEVLSEQAYVLEEWRRGSREINYRRFFDVNDLAAVRIENEKAFEWTHQLIKELLKKYPTLHGLRVDHVDGLTDPEAYLKKLRTLAEDVWVEKILGDGEEVPRSWPVNGSTGYEFSNITSRLFVDLAGVMHLHSHYVRHIDGRWARFHDCVYESKREMLETHFPSEIQFLSDQFYSYLGSGGEFTRDDICEVLMELSCSLKVYRTYRSRKGNEKCPWLTDAFNEVQGRGRVFSDAALEALRNLLLSENLDDEAFALVKRWEQLTGPVMAKGLEDTALYRYFPLLSLNVVGGEPDWTGDGAVEFHAFNREKIAQAPWTMNATSTHDTKRSEDVRSRIHVLSEVSEEWVKFFDKCYKQSRRVLKSQVDIHTEYLVYETLLGAWPFDGKVTADFIERMQGYFLKAVREAKSETSWVEPNPDFEAKLNKHVAQLLKPKTPQGRALLKNLSTFAGGCAYYGAFNSLSLLTLKVLGPGLPDFYQGTEMWDLSLVDPDNRRPVDYKLRASLLKSLKKQAKSDIKGFYKRLVKDWKSGEIKLWLTHELLKLRVDFPELFIYGDYWAVEAQGDFRTQFVSFLRHHDGRWVLVVVPRLLAKVQKVHKSLSLNHKKLLDTSLLLPENAPQRWKNALTGDIISAERLSVGDVLKGLPVGILIGL